MARECQGKPKSSLGIFFSIQQFCIYCLFRKSYQVKFIMPGLYDCHLILIVSEILNIQMNKMFFPNSILSKKIFKLEEL